MLLRDLSFIAVDFESTGVVGNFSSEPWQIGCIGIEQGQIIAEKSFTSLLRVGERPFHPQAPGLYNQHRKAISEAPTLHQLWPKLKEILLGRPLIAHNISTERLFFAKAWPLHTFGPWIDTLKLARIAYPSLPSHTLESLVEFLQLSPKIQKICPGLLPHNALYDAVACGLVFCHLIHLPGWENISIEYLEKATPDQFYQILSARNFSKSNIVLPSK
jgi:DNA polymerase-3 subunit epsilon